MNDIAQMASILAFKAMHGRFEIDSDAARDALLAAGFDFNAIQLRFAGAARIAGDAVQNAANAEEALQSICERTPHYA